MANYNIFIDLNKMQQSIRNVQRVQRSIDIGIDNGLNELEVRLTNKLKENLIKYGLGASKLMNSISVIRQDNGFSFQIVGEAQNYYMFVEFGTGIIGENNPHKKPQDWQYDVNEHGEEGWWYPTTPTDPNPSKYMTKSGEWIAWTAGMPSRPFMYDTWLYGARYGGRIVKKHIDRELKKVSK